MRALSFGLCLFLFAADAIAAPEMPKDVKACLNKGTMWLAAPRFFEAFDFTHANGSKERAYQIHDHLDGSDGFLLLFPKTCRLVVLVQKPSTHPIARNTFIAGPPGQLATAHESETLYRWAGAELYNPKAAAHAAVTALDRLDQWPQLKAYRPTLWVGQHVVAAKNNDGVPTLPARIWQTTPANGFNRVLDFRGMKSAPIDGDDRQRADIFVSPGPTSIALVAIRSADQNHHRFVGAWWVDKDVDARVEASRLWLVTRHEKGPRVVAIDLDGPSVSTLAFRLTQANVRVGLTADGVEVGAFSEPGQSYDWRAMDRVLRDQN